MLSFDEIEEGHNCTHKDEEWPVTYLYTFFHVIFSLSIMYSDMLLTRWTSSTTDGEKLIGVGWYTVWVRICTEWITAALYIWSLVAPLLFPDREFF